MKFAKTIFAVAGWWGILTLTPLFFLSAKIGINSPPAITHPEYYFGFLCVALAWQVAFLVIAKDPVRHRPVMLAALLEKWGYGLFSLGLFVTGRTDKGQLFFACIDLILGMLFLLAFAKLRNWPTQQRTSATAP